MLGLAVEVADAEARHGSQHRDDGPAFVGEPVDVAGRRRRQLDRGDKAGSLERAETVAQKVGGDAVEGVAKVGLAPLTKRELAADQQGPAVADEIESGGDRAVLPVGAFAQCHSSLDFI